MEPLKLDTLKEDAWRWLAEGLVDRSSPLRTPALGTVGTDMEPQARIVVLRALDAQAWTLDAHTDVRSAKYASLVARASVTLLFWDQERGVQIRAVGRASLHTDDSIADAAWGAALLASRAPYMSRRPPGEPIETPERAVFVRDAEHSLQGRPNFCVVRCSIRALDVLQLFPQGHRRACVTRDASTWVAP